MRTQIVRRCLVAAAMLVPMLGLLLLPNVVQAFGQTRPKKQTKVVKPTKKPAAKPAAAPVAPKAPAKTPDKEPEKPVVTPAKPDAPPAEKTEPDKPDEAKSDEAKPQDPAAPAATGAAPANATYTGAAACQVCHADTHKSWQKKKHASAFDLLVARKQEKNAACIKCHTTGYGRGGFVDAEKTPDLRGVTCESCHGPGSEHNGDKEKITRVPPATVCTDCHMKSTIH